MQHRITRRQLLGGLGGTALFARLGRLNALAQSGGDYKALVCVFLVGGNDGHNTIVPLTGAQSTNYKAIRGNLALPDNNGPVQQVTTPGGEAYGLNNGLSAIAPLWAQGRLGVIANCGMLARPTNRTLYLTNQVLLPTNLFSHSDQIAQMQSGVPSTGGGTGWGGRTMDSVASANGTSTFPSSLSINGPSLFCTGSVVQSASLLPDFTMNMSGMSLWPQSAADARKNGVQQLMQLDSGLALVQAANKVRRDAIDLAAMLNNSSASGLLTPFPGTSLGAQLRQVAKIIKLRASTGMSRQVFFCSIGGFDTHGAQAWQHWDLLRQVSEAMSAFYNATAELGVADKVTTFTLSDFGRTLQPSGSGSDHGWGNHQLILGGAVNGGRLFGTFPTMAVNAADDSGSRGAMIPTTSLDQVGANLATWFGVPSAQLGTVFPNLQFFPVQNLGFFS